MAKPYTMNPGFYVPAADRYQHMEYARCGKLTEETIRTLETPMIPKEDYLRGVNS